MVQLTPHDICYHYADQWKGDVMPLTGVKAIECWHCKTWHTADQWRVVQVPCEVCGDHPVLFCRVCNEQLDAHYDGDTILNVELE